MATMVGAMEAEAMAFMVGIGDTLDMAGFMEDIPGPTIMEVATMAVTIILGTGSLDTGLKHVAPGEDANWFGFPVITGNPRRQVWLSYSIAQTNQSLFFLSIFLYYTFMEKFITTNKVQTQKLGEMLAQELKGGEVICLSGDLGAGKTTFTQGFLKGLKIKGPYTSPTFVVIKRYHVTCNIKQKTKKMLHASCFMLHDIYHIDAYRIKGNDLLSLGWEEMIGNKKNIIIIEWAERVKKIIPKDAIWIRFKWIDENKRELEIS